MGKSNTFVNGLRRVDLSRATGCNLETIRFYEKIGVMPDPPRSSKGYRVYDATHVSRLRFVMRAKALGFTLDETRSLLDLVDGGIQTCAEVQSLALEQIKNVKAKIVDLNRIETILSDTVSRCTGDDVPQCAVIEALSSDTALEV